MVHRPESASHGPKRIRSLTTFTKGYAKDYVSYGLACPDEASPQPLIANPTTRARPRLCLLLFHFPFGLGQRASTVVFNPPLGVNSLESCTIPAESPQRCPPESCSQRSRKNPQAPVRQQVHLQCFQLDAQLSRHIFDCQRP